MTIAATIVGVYAWVLAGTALLVGIVTGLFPQKLWSLARRRNHD